jgi:heat-inducible transcriptional repressor
MMRRTDLRNDSDHGAPLNARMRNILHAVVELYLETGEPVASSAVAQHAKHGTAAATAAMPSPATIRNAMAELAERGLLTQPHASAGRIPSPAAIQLYVDSLPLPRGRRTEIQDWQRRLQEFTAWQDRVEEGTHWLTDLTQNVSLSAALPPASQTLHQVEITPLGGMQYLVIVVTADRAVHNQIVTLEQELRTEELQEIRNYINTEFSGWALEEARRELEARLEAEHEDYSQLLRRVELFYQRGLLDCGLAPYVFLDGAAYLVGLNLHLTRERLRELFQTLEQKKQILRILNQYLEGAARRPAVKVGLGEAHPALSEFSLVGVEVKLGAGAKARVAVLGPLRLNYQRILAAVSEVGQALETTSEN